MRQENITVTARPILWMAFSAAILCAGGWATSAAGGAELRAGSRTQFDAEGRVVRTAEGERINYDVPAPVTPQGLMRMVANGPFATLAADLAAPVAMEPAALAIRQEWYRAVYGWGIGSVGLNICDLDRDGQNEVLIGTAYPYQWYILRNTTAGYAQSYVSPMYTNAVNAVLPADINGDGRLEIIVVTGHDILTYSGSDYTLLGKLTTAARTTYFRNLQVIDVDRDGALEYVFTDGYDLFVYDVLAGSLEYHRTGLGEGYTSCGFAVGNVDDDSDLEIVTTDSQGNGLVLNGRTHVLKWSYPSGFGQFTRTGDVDGDGRDEIVAGNSWYQLRVLDADVHSPKYDIDVELDLDALRLADIDKDGKIEIIYGDGQWGSLYVHNGATGALKWSVPNPEHGVTDLGVGDTDGDGVNELLWGSGYSSSGSDYFYIVDSVTRQHEWHSQDIGGTFRALDYGDVDNDGRNELLYGCSESESGYEGGYWFVHDAASKVLEYTSLGSTESYWPGLYRIRHANIDTDPQQEVFVNSLGFSGLAICYDGISHKEQWRFTCPNGTVNCMQVGDVDADGQLELVAGSGAYLYVLNAATGTEEWHSVSLASSLSLLRLADVDQDGRTEMVVAAFGGSLFAYDGVTHLEEIHTVDVDASALEVADVNGDKAPEILLGRSNGAIEIRRGTDGSVMSTLGPYSGQIDGLAVADLTGDGKLEYVFAVKNELFIYDGANPAGAPLYRSGTIGNAVGAYDSLMLADIENDGSPEIVVNIGLGVQVYEISRGTGACCLQTGDGSGTCQITTEAECTSIHGVFAGAGVPCGQNADACDFCPNDPAKKAAGVCGCGVPDLDSDSDGYADCRDGCPSDRGKTSPGECGCGVPDVDSDHDRTIDCRDGCPQDAAKTAPGVCGCGVPDNDSDRDGVLDCLDLCPQDPQKATPGGCGCGVADTDSDGDTVPDCHDACPQDAMKSKPGACGCGVPDSDRDGDRVVDCLDACPDNPGKSTPGVCGCGVPDTDSDRDSVPDCIDHCPAAADVDSDRDGVLDCDDGCPNDTLKIAAGECGCGLSDADPDSDGTPTCHDACPHDPAKLSPGQCGCGRPDTDSDRDGTTDCVDGCPADPKKAAQGSCGCGVPDLDSDSDGILDCTDLCPYDPLKTSLGACGCGKADVDSDSDGKLDCVDSCPQDSRKTAPGQCGCGISDTDSDRDGKFDCQDSCPNDPKKSVPGQCGCGLLDTDSDHDGTADCGDFCPQDSRKTLPGACGCGTADADTDSDGTADCKDACPGDARKIAPGVCGCGKADADADSDGVADCVDNCPNKANADQADGNHDGVGDACTTSNEPAGQNQPNTNTGDNGNTGTNSGQSDNSSSLQIPNCGTGTAQAMAASLVALCLISSRTRRRQ